jgi:hypothetical protein
MFRKIYLSLIIYILPVTLINAQSITISSFLPTVTNIYYEKETFLINQILSDNGRVETFKIDNLAIYRDNNQQALFKQAYVQEFKYSIYKIYLCDENNTCVNMPSTNDYNVLLTYESNILKTDISKLHKVTSIVYLDDLKNSGKVKIAGRFKDDLIRLNTDGFLPFESKKQGDYLVLPPIAIMMDSKNHIVGLEITQKQDNMGYFNTMYWVDQATYNKWWDWI